MHRRTLLASLAFAGAAPSLIAAPVAAAPRANAIDGPWSRFGAGAGPDHGPWTTFLGQYRRLDRRSGVALINYKAAKAGGRRALSRYLDALQKTDPTKLSKDAAFAFWANLYNAKTVDLVLEEYPVSSIKKVRGGLFNRGPWRDKVMKVAGRDLSLDDVEHGVLRPVWGDPRIHYAVNCAAIGCPNLQAKAWTPDTLDADLDKAARDYVNDPRGAKVSGGRLTVSSIYEWFQADFGGSDSGVIAHLRAFAEPKLKAQLKGVTRVYDDAYDWSLNDVA